MNIDCIRSSIYCHPFSEENFHQTRNLEIQNLYQNNNFFAIKISQNEKLITDLNIMNSKLPSNLILL